jgi:hypothetical protein
VVLSGPLSALSQICKFVSTHPGKGVTGGGVNVFIFIAKKPRVQACVLSFPPDSHHDNGILLTQMVSPDPVVVYIPAG